MSKKGFAKRVCIALVMCLLLCALCSCKAEQTVCFYGYFEDHAFAFVYSEAENSIYSIRLPLEQILLWGKGSGLDSITTAMRNYVGLKDSGFLLGTSNSLVTVRDLLDGLGSDEEGQPSSAKRMQTLVSKASVLSKKPLSDKISQLCGTDSAELLKLLAEKSPDCYTYDAYGFFDSEDLNFSQRYFTEWLGQVLRRV